MVALPVDPGLIPSTYVAANSSSSRVSDSSWPLWAPCTQVASRHTHMQDTTHTLKMVKLNLSRTISRPRGKCFTENQSRQFLLNSMCSCYLGVFF